MLFDLEPLLDLATALGLGLLIGTERGWSAREQADANPAAGIRTFGLTGLLGGLAVLCEQLVSGAWITLAVLFSGLVAVNYLRSAPHAGDRGMANEVALLTTLVLGSLAAHDRLLAAGCAVVVTLLLNLRDVLHNGLRRLTADEIRGALKLLFISVVLLPALPNEGYGPWEVFNPYQTWWMVVLIAAIGFAAYAAIRLLGARHGLLLTALLGGIVSSTAMTITLSRLAQPRLLHALAAGLLATSALMFPRVLVEVGVINPALLQQLIWPMATSGAVYAMGALFYFRRAAQQPETPTDPPLKNPFELGPALRFAALLVGILFLVEAARRNLGDAGVYLVALVSGLTDVDAITLTLSRNALGELDEQVAVQGIFLAALSNSLVKAGLVVFIGGRALALRTLPVMVGGLLLGGLVLLLF